jgi:hypothetical protein
VRRRHKKALLPWQSNCPHCKKRSPVFIYDSGLQFLLRFVVGNNRFGCRECAITWRRWRPFEIYNISSHLKKDQ